MAEVGVPVAPPAPGKLGEAIREADLLPYLDALGEWHRARKGELDRLDAAALATSDPDAYAADLGLALALWQSIGDRYQGVVKVWDSGRVGRREREQLSRLIWGRLEGRDAARAGGFAVSLVEASRLSDALAAQLRGRLVLDPAGGDPAATAVRLRALRAQRERCRDLEGGAAIVTDLGRRIDDLAARAARGADVAGALALLEHDASRAERDLIVAASRRRDLVRDHDRAIVRRDALAARAPGLRDLAQRCAREIIGAPRLAVPDASVLPPAPTDRAELDAYLARLDSVAAALDHVENAYSAPLAERDALRGRLGGYRSMAQRGGLPQSEPVSRLYDEAAAVLMRVPCDLIAGRALVDRYQHLVRGSASA